jgi:hypothetical protein
MSLVVEGTVIVFSILLAFGLEAAWSARLESRETSALLMAIRSDVVENRQVIARTLAQSERLSQGARTLLNGLAGGESGAARDSLLSTVGNIFLMSGWDPINDTYLEAHASGRLSLISDHRTRLELSRYQRRIEAVEDVVGSTQSMYYSELEPFLVANTVYSEVGAAFWREGLDLAPAPFATDFDHLASSRELWNLVTLRLELEVAFQNYLQVVDSIGAGLLEILPDS